MIFANGDQYVGMWKSDQMCDPDGVYLFANGNEYRGTLRTCPRLTARFGCFEGLGVLKIAGKGASFDGTFKSNKIQGYGTLSFNDGRPSQEKIWEPTSIDDFIK